MFRCDGRHTCGVKCVDRRGDRGVLGAVSFWGLAEYRGPSWVQSARRAREPSVAGGRLAANFSTPPGEPIGRDAIGDGVL